MFLLLGATLLCGVAAEPIASADTCEREAAVALRLPRMRFCSFVEPTVVGIMLTVTIAQSMFIGYLLLAKQIHGYGGREADERIPAEGRSLEEFSDAAGVMESPRLGPPPHADRESRGGQASVHERA